MAFDAPPEEPVGVWEELRRRRVVRVGVAYVAIVFAVLEAADFVVAGMADPERIDRALVGIAALGFPLTIVLAFLYDITPSGVVKTPEDATDDPEYDEGPGRRWGWVVVAAVILGLLLRSIGP